MPPTQTREACIVPIRCDPLASRFDRQRRKIRVWDQVSFCLGGTAELCENIPMTLPRGNRDVIGQRTDLLNELKGRLQRCRWIKYPRVRDNSQKTRQNEVGHPNRLVRGDLYRPPTRKSVMIRRILPVDINKDVHIRKNHAFPSIRSSNPAESSRSIPGNRPLPPNVVKLTGRRWLLFSRLASDCRRASSTTAVKVRPLSIAARFASRMRASSNCNVVLIHKNISSKQKYVKKGDRAYSRRSSMPAHLSTATVDAIRSLLPPPHPGA